MYVSLVRPQLMRVLVVRSAPSTHTRRIQADTHAPHAAGALPPTEPPVLMRKRTASVSYSTEGATGSDDKDDCLGKIRVKYSNSVR